MPYIVVCPRNCAWEYDEEDDIVVNEFDIVNAKMDSLTSGGYLISISRLLLLMGGRILCCFGPEMCFRNDFVKRLHKKFV